MEGAPEIEGKVHAASESSDWQKEIVYEVSDDLILTAHRQLLGIWNLCKIFMVVVTPMYFVAWVFLRNKPDTLWGAFLVLTIFIMLFVAFYFFSYVRTRRSLISTLHKMPHRTQKLTFTEGGLLAESPLGHSDLKWNLITQVRKFPDIWIINFGSHIQFVVPTEYIDAQFGFFLDEKTIENGGKIHDGI